MESNCPPQFWAIILVAGVAFFVAPRAWILPIFVAVSIFVGMNFRVYFLNLNFYSTRIFLLLAWLSVAARGQVQSLSPGPMDRAVLAFSCAMVIVEVLRRGLPGLVYGVANFFYDILGIYFLCRMLIREREDLVRMVGSLAVICVVLAGFMTAERLTRHNWLKPLGGCTEWVTARDGKLRCQATFLHSVLAGTFGAVLLPLFTACWWQGENLKKLAVAGCVASVLITFAAGSSGPIMTLAAGMGAICAWPLRHQMRPLRWAILLTLVGLHLVMNAPVWALIARVSSLTGGSGWHRFNILDTFINHVGDWWLIGTEATDWGWLTEDVANQYCIVAKHGGLIGLILFIRILVVGFREVGVQFDRAAGDRPTEILLWAFGSLLFVHLITFFATSYFDQTQVLWLLTLAMVASLSLLPAMAAQEEAERWEEPESWVEEGGVSSEPRPG